MISPPPAHLLRNLLLGAAAFLPVPLIAQDDLETTAHSGLISAWDGAAIARGRQIYTQNCAVCHGLDGKVAPNPLSAKFAEDTLKNGADPLSMFKTLTLGFQNMPGQSWLTPKQRYDVIHYIRETFFKPHNKTQYSAITEDYLDSLPVPKVVAVKSKRTSQYGPALYYEIGDLRRALHVRLSQGKSGLHILYDTGDMSAPAVWTGEGVDLKDSHHTSYKGEKRGRVAGKITPVGTWRWIAESAENPAPEIRFRGHFQHAETVVLHYSVGGRDILEMPSVQGRDSWQTIAQTLRIEPGDQTLHLDVGGAGKSAVLESLGGKPAGLSAPATGTLAITNLPKGDAFGALAIGAADGALWEIRDGSTPILTIPPSKEPQIIRIVRATGDLGPFRTFAAVDALSKKSLIDPANLTTGGDRLWPEQLKTKGTPDTAPFAGAYAFDQIEVPLENPWQSWMRLSGIGAFPDGRLAVSTFNGDVWIVSGIDEPLSEITWNRFATGLYEPLGLRVIDNKILVQGRDRITRLHDLNEDGEADHYENFFAYPAVGMGYHAFSFDLVQDDDGFLYTITSGRKNDQGEDIGWVWKIAPDGSSSERIGGGFRHPNGMGYLPSRGWLTASDNQGEWIPASKISIIRKDGFYGYGKTPYPDRPKTREDDARYFDRPILWLPQEADNSSGAQLEVGDPRFGPLATSIIHGSYGRSRLFYCLTQMGGAGPAGVRAAAAIPFGPILPSGVMRQCVNPADGAVYVACQKGWDSSATLDGSIYRIRHTGKPFTGIKAITIGDESIRLDFGAPRDDLPADPAKWKVGWWNYHYTSKYGSEQFPPPGQKSIGAALSKITLSPKNDAVTLHLPGVAPVDQIKISWGDKIDETIFLTIHPKG